MMRRAFETWNDRRPEEVAIAKTFLSTTDGMENLSPQAAPGGREPKNENSIMDLDQNCPACSSGNLLHGSVKGEQYRAFFKMRNARFRFTCLDTPSLAIQGDATACLDCGMVWLKVDTEKLREKADRWLDADAKKPLDPE